MGHTTSGAAATGTATNLGPCTYGPETATDVTKTNKPVCAGHGADVDEGFVADLAAIGQHVRRGAES